jgi:hypothetical protein
MMDDYEPRPDTRPRCPNTGMFLPWEEEDHRPWVAEDEDDYDDEDEYDFDDEYDDEPEE